MIQILESWGRVLREKHNSRILENNKNIYIQIKNNLPGLPYGLGKSYGDVCLNTHGNVWQTSKLNRCINFNSEKGTIDCQAGISLYEIHKITIPNGWMMPVSPGTQFISIGGAIANNIHGKNQHVMGTLSEHILNLKLLRTDG
mgnify:CR=1 FL=1